MVPTLQTVCRPVAQLPPAIVTAVDDEYDIDTMSPKVCSATAKAAGKGCKNAVKDLSTCDVQFDRALIRADLLACAQLTDPGDRKACEADVKADQKELQTQTQQDRKAATSDCGEVPPEITDRCDD
jgi:hypothetical protein